MVTDFSAKVGDHLLEANIEVASTVDEHIEEELENGEEGSRETLGFGQLHDNPTNCTDLFMCSIENPPANATIEVAITLFHELFLTGDVFTLVMPTSFLPRIYAHEDKKNTPPSKFFFALDLEIVMFDEISTVYSPLHTIEFHKSSDDPTAGSVTIKV